MTPTLTEFGFTVPGVPVAQGDLSINPRTHRLYHQNGARLEPWRESIKWVAKSKGAKVLEGPVTMRLAFGLPRPKSHFGTGKNAGIVKPTAPRYPLNRPDLDKLCRAVLDSLTGICYHDDAQVAAFLAEKCYAREPYVKVQVAPL